MNNNIYIINDMDMHFVVGAHKTIEKVLKTAMTALTTCGYSEFTLREENEDEWFITFPHYDTNCISHWHVTRVELEE